MTVSIRRLNISNYSNDRSDGQPGDFWNCEVSLKGLDCQQRLALSAYISDMFASAVAALEQGEPLVRAAAPPAPASKDLFELDPSALQTFLADVSAHTQRELDKRLSQIEQRSAPASLDQTLAKPVEVIAEAASAAPIPEKPKRVRRTKAELAAAGAVAEPEHVAEPEPEHVAEPEPEPEPVATKSSVQMGQVEVSGHTFSVIYSQTGGLTTGTVTITSSAVAERNGWEPKTFKVTSDSKAFIKSALAEEIQDHLEVCAHKAEQARVEAEGPDAEEPAPVAKAKQTVAAAKAKAKVSEPAPPATADVNPQLGLKAVSHITRTTTWERDTRAKLVELWLENLYEKRAELGLGDDPAGFIKFITATQQEVMPFKAKPLNPGALAGVVGSLLPQIIKEHSPTPLPAHAAAGFEDEGDEDFDMANLVSY